MAFFKRRPRVQVLVPRVVHPGEKFDAVFELDVERPVPIEHFDVTLRGRTRIAVGDQGFADSGVPLSQTARLSGPVELAPGKARFPCRFSIPDDAPPSFGGRIVRVSYVLGAQIAIPWWIDVDRAFELTVAPRSLDAARSPKPLLYSSAPDGPREREPHAEVSLADGVVQPGDVLHGAVALGNVAFARYTGIRVTLAGFEYAHGMERQGEFGGWQIEIPLASPREGEPIAFDLRVPDVPTSMANDLFRVWWLLEVTVTRRLGDDLVVALPITVLPAGSGAGRPTERLIRAPPSVGNARVQRVWGEVAARAGMHLEGERLEARVGAVDVSLHRDHPEGQAKLVAEIRFPSLGLELQGGPAGGLSRLWSTEGVSFGHDHRVTGRDTAQVQALVDAIQPEIGSARVRRFDDERLVLERSAAGLTAEPVAALAAAALAVAALIPKVVRALPPPASIDLGPWHELATALRGELLPARPSVRGELDGRRVEVAQLWSPGAVSSSVEVSVLTPTAIPERFIASRDWPSEARVMADEWAAREVELAVSSERVSARLPGALVDAGAVLEAAGRLVGFGDVLCLRRAYR